MICWIMARSAAREIGQLELDYLDITSGIARDLVVGNLTCLITTRRITSGDEFN